MRIIAGTWSSRRIETLDGDATRPTLDKVREAVFSSLGTYFEGGAMLDLYAGSGAVGLEALSRGMDQLVSVEKSHAACNVIRKNIDSLQCRDRVRLLNMSDERALQILAQEGMQFDLVYLDPPYRLQKDEKVMAYLCDHGMLKEGSRVVVESLKEETFPEETGFLHQEKSKVYGISRITYYIARHQ